MAMSIKLDQSTEDRLHYLARETGRTISFYVREAIESKLEDLEDIYLAEKALEDIRAGRSSVVTWESMKKTNNL